MCKSKTLLTPTNMLIEKNKSGLIYSYLTKSNQTFVFFEYTTSILRFYNKALDHLQNIHQTTTSNDFKFNITNVN